MNTRAAVGTDKDRLSIGQVFSGSLNKGKASRLHPGRPAAAKQSVFVIFFFFFQKCHMYLNNKKIKKQQVL